MASGGNKALKGPVVKRAVEWAFLWLKIQKSGVKGGIRVCRMSFYFEKYSYLL